MKVFFFFSPLGQFEISSLYIYRVNFFDFSVTNQTLLFLFNFLLISIFLLVCLTKVRTLNLILINMRFLAQVIFNLLLSVTPVTDVLVAAANAPVEPILNGVWVGTAIFVCTTVFAVMMGGNPVLIIGLITVDSVLEHVSRDSKTKELSEITTIEEDVVTSIATTLENVQEQSDFPNFGTTLYQGLMDPAVQKAVEAGETLPVEVRVVGGVLMGCCVILCCINDPLLFWLIIGIEYTGRLIYEYKPSTQVKDVVPKIDSSKVVSEPISPPDQVVDQIIVVVADTPADMTVFYYLCIFGVFLCISLFFVALFRK